MKIQHAILACAVVCTTPAMANPLYVQADVGYSHLTAKNSNPTAQPQNLDGGDALGRIAVGTTVGTIRYALDYTRFGNAEHTTHSSQTLNANDIAFIPAGTYPVENTKEIDAHSIGLSAYYNLPSYGKLTPYVGARLGANRLSHEQNQELQHGTADYDLNEQSQHKNQLGGGVSFGASYQVLPALAVDVGAEYNHLGKVEGYKVNQYSGKAGIRYQF